MAWQRTPEIHAYRRRKGAAYIHIIEKPKIYSSNYSEKDNNINVVKTLLWQYQLLVCKCLLKRPYSVLGVLLPLIIIKMQDYSRAFNTENTCRVYSVENVPKTELVFRLPFYNIWSCTCSFEYRWLTGYICNPFYYHLQTGSIHLSHCFHIIPRLCVSCGCTIIICHLLHVYPGNTGTLFPFYMYSLWCVQMNGYILACRSCSFVCSLHCLIIVIMQTCPKALIIESAWQVYDVEGVSKTKPTLSIIFYTVYRVVYLQLT